MKILILGGTQFVGRHIVEAVLTAGHTVSILNRGKLPDEFLSEVERFRADRDEGMAALHVLTGRTWDACVDVSGYLPRQVRPSVEKLNTAVGHYIFVSAVSVYGNPDHGPVYETNPILQPASEDLTEIINTETYGALKVTCENIVQQAYADRFTILRSQIVAGPYDPQDRFSYWVRRSTLKGEMLAPGDGSDYLQVIDTGDVARFTRTVIEKKITGIFNLAGPRLTWSEFMKILGAKNIIWVSNDIIKSAGLTEFELPLYRPKGGARSSLMYVNNTRALKAGLTLTALENTVKDTQAWLLGRNITPALSQEIEAKLIYLARSQ